MVVNDIGMHETLAIDAIFRENTTLSFTDVLKCSSRCSIFSLFSKFVVI
ncbi:10986_t:CDS:2 [Funneliformis mosseae]|uniref:10986_t:CDS:1 n=1 Tax=Funneliformis mosseae TaxID=27381 RepID=A0A9N9GN25_FUNMO|nr:10986_t:CDS:2 [Funneliformis mosseae]